MIILKALKRISPDVLFPLVKRAIPRRCYLSGQTEAHQMPFPPPWMHKSKNFNNPKLYPLEIEHKNEDFNDNRTANLAWASKVPHLEKTMLSWKFVMRRKKRRGG